MKYLLNDNVEQLNLDDALAHVSDQRRNKALHFRHESSRKESLAAYILLCQQLHDEYGLEQFPIFQETITGKPFLPERPDIHFNLSHTRGVVACVVDQKPVGIDVERIRPYNDSLARHVLSNDEYNQLQTQTEKDVAFVKMWTQKESLLKLTGEGIRRELNSVLLNDSGYAFHTHVNREKGYVCTICTMK